MQQNDLTTGIWKFADKVGMKELIEVANEWAKDENFVQLYIRKVSKDQNGIGFSFRRKDDSRETQDAFFDEHTDKLKRMFGNDLVGWDISSSTYTVKGF